MGTKFELIQGGKDDPRLSTEMLEASITQRLQRQADLSQEETRRLMDDIRDFNIRSLREKIAKYNDRIMTDEELLFIRSHTAGLVGGDPVSKMELYARFPELKDYFNDILEKLNLKDE